MSKVVKQVASIALPIAGAYFGGPIGGAIGGAISGGIINKGGLIGAALGGATGYFGAGAAKDLVGTAAGTALQGAQGPTMGSGILGAVTGGGTRALAAGVSGAASGVLNDPSKLLLGLGNQAVAQGQADTAKEAAQTQADALQQGIATQAPYNALGTNAANQIQSIQADPGAYVQNNPFYKSLADDAQQRLLANQAAKGKVGSGGTAAALQEQLLNLGNGLVQQQVGTLQNQVNSGQNAANATSNLQGEQGTVQAGGQVGASNALASGYNNQISTLLAMQGLNKTPIYSPTLNL